MITRTTTALLEGLTDPADRETWQAFDARFRPILVGFGRRLGLAAEDAADAAQETLASFVRSYREGKYARERGRLRAWLIGIARHCIRDVQRARVAQAREHGISAIVDVADEARMTQIWEAECEQEILRHSLAELRRQTKTDERTIRAFEMVAFGGQRPADVAEALNMSANDVYLAKHRCLKRLREIVADLNDLYEVA
ncbi:MAG: RNA polymerase sigma factor [Planctomycetota bacterium]|jgi:RNA polymerase sigma-70 factor (ECF subfamily)